MWQTNWEIISLIAVVWVASTAGLFKFRWIAVLNDRLGCVATWLDQAKSLHRVQMKEPASFTGDEMRKLMESVDSAYGCATQEPSLGHPPGAGSFGQYGVLPQK